MKPAESEALQIAQEGMNTGPHADLRQLRVLVAIASYGHKNLKFLEQIIQTYRNMSFATDIVVLSEAPKDLGPGVEVIVGLPSRNPWTLPFAHKAIFAQRVEEYDLFVYSEDDIGASEGHLTAFLDATEQLAPDEIAGFLRYEIDQSGTRYLTEPWGHFHWIPESVRQRGRHLVAEFTNEHAGFYVLTQSQLKRAIESGGFLRGPCRGRYDWPETAATDPYTNCGFRKVICVSALDDFLIHHMPNRYVDQLDVSLASFRQQIQALTDIRDGIHPASTLSEVESRLMPFHWQKSYYEKPNEELLNMVPRHARHILSIGCGWGATESSLLERGANVTALPLDSVIGAIAELRGIEVIYGNWEQCQKILSERAFDCVLLTNLLHLQRNPAEMVYQCSRVLRTGGTMVLSGPNFNRASIRLKRALKLDGFSKLQSYDLSGFSVCEPKTLATYLKRAGLHVTGVHWLNHSFERAFLRGGSFHLGSLTARDWVLQARI